MINGAPLLGVGANLAGAGALAWTALPQDTEFNLIGNYIPYPAAQASSGTSLAVRPAASWGYVAELRYPGVYKLDGNSGGMGGRAQRFTYLQQV